MTPEDLELIAEIEATVKPDNQLYIDNSKEWYWTNISFKENKNP